MEPLGLQTICEPDPANHTKVPAVRGIMQYSGKIKGIAIALVLAAAVLTLYWPVTGFDFIALDDNLYLLENPQIQKGISPEGITWAMTTLHTTNWHPLTWLSLLADYELYGFYAGGYHVTSLVLHLLNVMLLFAILQMMTKKAGRAALVAAIFAVHPLNIESVVWIAERKNLLSTLLAFSTIFAYLRYTRGLGWGRYSVVILLFALGLMAKPMLVSLPFVLLLLDYWPLERVGLPARISGGTSSEQVGFFSGYGQESLSERRDRRLLFLLCEKIPLFLLSFLSILITLYAAITGGAMKSLALFPLSGRIANAVISYISYLEMMIYPLDLAIFYPYQATHLLWQVIAAATMLMGITVMTLFGGQKRRYLSVGWLWYLITLFPVIGIVQVGFQAMANRYAYFPLVGIFIIVVWGGADLLRRYARRRYLPVAVAGALIFALAVGTRLEMPHWQNSEAAFVQALKVTKNNHIAELGLGNIRLAQGQTEAAQRHYEESLRSKPDYAEAHNNLAMILSKKGQNKAARTHYLQALAADPGSEKAHNNFGVLLVREGNRAEAERFFRAALKLKPDYVSAANNLAMLFVERGDLDGAMARLQETLKLLPGDSATRKNLEMVKKRVISREKRGNQNF